jgi:hypothetical protein
VNKLPILIPQTSRTSKIAPASTNRNIATVPAPSDTASSAENKIKIFTFFTTAGKTLNVYNGDRLWAKVTLTLETAGPVSVGEQADLQPVLSGRGLLLQTGIPAVFNVAKGNILYVAAASTNRIGVVVEAYPWLEIITGGVTGILDVRRGGAAAALRAATSPPRNPLSKL